jgi:hypothetical protein
MWEVVMSIEKQIANYMRYIGAVLVRSNKHNVWRLPNGRVVVTSKSPSDADTFKVVRGCVRRALAGAF